MAQIQYINIHKHTHAGYDAGPMNKPLSASHPHKQRTVEVQSAD